MTDPQCDCAAETEPQVDGTTLADCPFWFPDHDHSGPLNRLHLYSAILADAGKTTIYTQEPAHLPPLVLRRVGLIPAMEQALREAVQQLIDEARAGGMTWEQIGAELGVSRQAANQRFGGGR